MWKPQMIPLADEWDAMLSRTEPMESQTVAEDVKPWTIKGIGPEERNAAIAAADRADVLIGEWMCRAIRSQVKLDQRTDIASSGPSSGSPETSSENFTQIAQLIEIARGMQSLSGISTRTAALPIALIRAKLKAAKG